MLKVKSEKAVGLLSGFRCVKSAVLKVSIADWRLATED
jgi:hypothetical protein